MTKLHKCFTETSCMINSGKFPKPLKTQPQVRDFQFAFNSLSTAGLATTVLLEVSSLFKKYGFNAQEDDVGFIITGVFIMIFDFFENLTGDYDVAYLMTNLIVLFGIVFLFVFPFLIPVFRNSYFIDKMNKKNKRQNKSFDTQLSKLLGDTGRSDELSECKREIEELKKEIARLKKAKK